MRLTRLNPETGEYECTTKAKTLAEFRAQRKAVIQRLGEFEENAEWISVEDRLPDKEGKYLISTINGYVTFGYFGDYGDGSPKFEKNLRFDYRNVIYWMPLPEVPKMKGADDEPR